MIAFTVFGRPIYWYGICYVLSFILWYLWLSYIAKRINAHSYPKLAYALLYRLDDIIMYIMLGVIIGGRLWDVFLYNWSYYSEHLSEIVAIRNGGMSFVWWFIGVALAMFFVKWRFSFSLSELFLLFDYIVLFLPIWILLWRVANGLNQELYGKVVDFTLIWSQVELLYNLKAVRIFDQVDQQRRRNTNMFEWFFEGFFILLILTFNYLKSALSWLLKPGAISWLFCILYGCIRFSLEYLRDNPNSEYIYGILKSQILMVFMVGLWGLIFLLSKKVYKNSISTVNSK